MKPKKRRNDAKIDSGSLQDPQISSTILSDSEKAGRTVETDEEFAFLDEAVVQNRARLSYQKNKLGEKWYDMQFNDISANDKSYDLSPDLLSKFEKFAEQLLDQETKFYVAQKDSRKSSESSWLRNVSVGGTVGDKLAALIVQIHESPVLNIARIRSLISNVDKSNRREALLTAETFRDLCSQNLMPDRKLVPFRRRPLANLKELSSGNKLTMEKRLIFWLFEDKLKLAFEDFVKQLEKITHDTLETNRIKAVGILTDLLIKKPEQEQFLLASVVNKLGDPSAKVASKVVGFLGRVLESHNQMNSIVINDIKNLVYRLHISPRAQYYGVVFLTQIKLRVHLDIELACQLISIYFGLFKLLVEKNSVDNKMLALLLRGTNKAFPIAKGQKNLSILSDVDSLYKVVAIGGLNTSLQALLLLLQVTEASEGVTDRFYCSLYRKLMDPCLETSSSNHPLFFHVLYKALKSDPVESRTGAFLKRLLQLALYSAPPLACGILMLISELIQEKPALLRLAKNAQNEDFLTINNASLDDDDEEHFTDVHEAESEAEDISHTKDTVKNLMKPSWVHKRHLNTANLKNKFAYDPSNRNPMFANAQASLLYELTLLRHHYHPSVALFAEKVFQNEGIDYEGDPLQDFTLMRFLDRFSYRNPKKRRNDSKNDENGQKAKKLPRRTSYTPWGVKNFSVTSEDYVKAPEEQVPVDEKFLHRYMKSFGTPKVDDDREDGASVASEEFDEMLSSGKVKIPT